MKRLTSLIFSRVLIGCLAAPAAETVTQSADEILAKLENTNTRRHAMLQEYSGLRRYTLHNLRFGKLATADVRMTYDRGEHCTVLTRTGSEKLSGIIDKVLASEDGASLSPEYARHDITAANYRVRLLGTEVTAGRTCYVLELAPKAKAKYLLAGKAWIDSEDYALVRLEGRFAASLSILVGAPHLTEEFSYVDGFWLPAHVRSVATSFLLGPSELDILYSNYHLTTPKALGAAE